MTCLREPYSSAWILNANAFVQDPVHLWKKLTHPLPEASHSRSYFSRLMAFWLYFLTSFPSFFKKKKKKGTQTPIIWLFWDVSLPSSQSANFPNKVAIPCLNTSSVSLTGLLWGEESELELSNSNTAICGSLFMTSHTRNKVHHKLSITNFTFEIKDREEFNLIYR